MDRITILFTVNSKIDVEQNNHGNWRLKSKNYTLKFLSSYDLNNHITKETRIGKNLIDHVISNIPANRILHLDILLYPTIRYHDPHYLNTPFNKFETR